MNTIFVYGTLKREKPLHRSIAHQKFVGSAVTKEKYPMTQGSEFYPKIFKEEGVGHRVKGEVFEVNDGTMQKLDYIEHHPHWYCREQIPVEVNGKEILAWCYFMKGEKRNTRLKLLEVF